MTGSGYKSKIYQRFTIRAVPHGYIKSKSQKYGSPQNLFIPFLRFSFYLRNALSCFSFEFRPFNLMLLPWVDHSNLLPDHGLILPIGLWIRADYQILNMDLKKLALI